MKSVACMLIALSLVILTGCGGGSEDMNADISAQVNVQDFQYTRVPGGARFVSGKLHNPTGEPIKNAQIQIALFDADNRLITTMNVIVSDVQPGQDKPFSQPVDADDSVRRARVRGILVL